MPIDLFDPSVQRESARKFSGDDVVGRFRSGYQVGGRPASLKQWRVTTGDPDVASKVQSTFGGEEPQSWETKGEDTLEVFTEAPSVDIVLSGPDAIDARMLIWARGSKRIATCEGTIFETEGAPYVCEKGGFRNKREHEEQGHVCEPRVSVTFRLADDPDLGLFKFESGAWSLATAISRAIGDIQKYDGAVKATLSLEYVDLGNGKAFTKPVIKVTGAA